MKYRVLSPDYKTKTKPVEIWTQIEATSEYDAALFFAASIMNGPEDGEKIEIWVHSDRLYKFHVWVEITYNAEEIKNGK